MAKTIFILAGGSDRKVSGFAKRLEDEITKHVSRPKILSCFFSSPEDQWVTKYREWREWLNESFTRKFTYEYARKTPFLKQVDAADVIFLHGGNTQLLFDTLPAAEELTSHFEGKVVIGSSAGANVLSKDYWSSSRAVPAHGLGIVDVNIMVHYGTVSHEGRERTLEDWKKEEAEFKKFIGGGKIARLPEGQFIVIKK